MGTAAFGGSAMVRTAVLALVIGLVGSSASALPLLSAGQVAQTDRIIEVKIVCTVDGICERPPTRRPVARWVYGDGAFFGPGPYRGPGEYGPPNSHWRWFPFFGSYFGY